MCFASFPSFKGRLDEIQQSTYDNYLWNLGDRICPGAVDVTADYETEMREIAARNGNYDKVIVENNNGGGNGQVKRQQLTEQVEKPKAKPANGKSSSKTPSIARYKQEKAKAKNDRECEQCNKTTTYINPKGEHVWHGNKKDGWTCNSCYFKMRRLDQLGKQAHNTTLKIEHTAAQHTTNAAFDIEALFGQQIELLRQNQAKIKARLAEIEKEKTSLLKRAQTLTNCIAGLMSVDNDV